MTPTRPPNPTNKSQTIKLGGKEYELFFDLNTYASFETASGKLFTDMLFELQEAVAEGEKRGDKAYAIRRIPLKMIRAFLWAAVHTYDQDGEPQWPLTMGQLGRLIDINNLGSLLPNLLRGAGDNLPEPVPVTVAPSPNGKVPHPIEGTTTSSPDNGGSEFGPSDVDVLGLLDKTSID